MCENDRCPPSYQVDHACATPAVVRHASCSPRRATTCFPMRKLHPLEQKHALGVVVEVVAGVRRAELLRPTEVSATLVDVSQHCILPSSVLTMNSHAHSENRQRLDNAPRSHKILTRSAACATCCCIAITTRHTQCGSSVMLLFKPYPQRRSSTRRTGCVLLCGRRRGRRHAVLGQISFCVSVVCSKMRVTSSCTCQGGCMIYDIVNDSPLVRRDVDKTAMINVTFDSLLL
jgi:hypothetical protein